MGGLTFRRWLSDRLLGTEFARMPIPDDEIDAVAKRIGVDPDLLVEVRMRARVLRASRGVQDPLGTKRAGTRHMQVMLPMPEIVKKDWREECEWRGVDPPALLRSCIHEYLLHDREPEQLLGYWFYKDRKRACSKKTNEFNEKVLITHGAWRALRRRADRHGCASTAIMRALVLEVLAGQHRNVPLVDARTMYDDEDRYYLGDPVGD